MQSIHVAHIYTLYYLSELWKVLRDQSLKIVGSLNFLGNPTGLVSDFASGVSGMMSQTPDVVGLVRDITHGVTDTASKVSFYTSSMPM